MEPPLQMCCDLIAATVDRKQTERYRADPPAKAAPVAKMGPPEPPCKFVCPRDQPQFKKSGSLTRAGEKGAPERGMAKSFPLVARIWTTASELGKPAT